MNKDVNIATIQCNLAASRQDLRAAFQLIYRRYEAANLTRYCPVGLRISSHQLDDGCEIYVAKHLGRVVGTISVFGETASRLPLECSFPSAFKMLRERGLNLVEIGCLAIDTEAELRSTVFASLTRTAIVRARDKKCDRMVAAVHPRHARFYERAMGFQTLSQPVSYDAVEGHLAVCVAGNPNDPAGYRSPWREVLFEESETSFHCGVIRSMSIVDRQYFLSCVNSSLLSPAAQAA
jgi:hypothetical protein